MFHVRSVNAIYFSEMSGHNYIKLGVDIGSSLALAENVLGL